MKVWVVIFHHFQQFSTNFHNFHHFPSIFINFHHFLQFSIISQKFSLAKESFLKLTIWTPGVLASDVFGVGRKNRRTPSGVGCHFFIWRRTILASDVFGVRRQSGRFQLCVKYNNYVKFQIFGLIVVEWES